MDRIEGVNKVIFTSLKTYDEDLDNEDNKYKELFFPPGPYDPDKFLKFAISNDDRIYFTRSIAKKVSKIDKTAYIDDYVGTIYIPNTCAIQVNYVDSHISGIVGSPAYICSNFILNLAIEEKSGLELIVYTEDRLDINGVRINANKTSIGDFEEYRRRFERKNRILPKPDIIEDRFGKTANFPQYDNDPALDICAKYGLVSIFKENGPANIYYPILDRKYLQDINNSSIDAYSQPSNHNRKVPEKIWLFHKAVIEDRFELAARLKPAVLKLSEGAGNADAGK